MPFSTHAGTEEKEWDSIYENIFKIAVEGAGFKYKCERSNVTSGSFTKEIVENMKNAHVVLADITGFNGNVMWELGVRHSLSLRTIMTVKGKILDETIISDLKNYGVITYENNASGIESFKKKIRTALKKFEEVPDRPDNPVFDFLKTEDLVLNTFERKMTANRLVGFLNELLSNLNISEGITSKKFKIEAEFVTNKRMKTDAYKFLVTTNYHIFNNNATIVFHSSISWLDALNHYLELLDKSMIENINDEYRNNIIKEIHIRAIKVTDRLKEMIEIINEEIQSLKQNKFQDYEPLIVYHDPEHKKLIEKK